MGSTTATPFSDNQFTITGVSMPSGASMPVQGVAGGQALPISVASLPLPAGSSTASLQTTGNTSLASILAALTAPLPLQSGAASQTTLAAIQTLLNSPLPLPTGASTSALQTAGNTILSAIQTALGPAATAALQTAGNTSLASLVTMMTAGISTQGWIATNTIAGNGFIASQQNAITLTLLNLRMLFTNPTGSGKTAYIYFVSADNSASVMPFATGYVNPTTNKPTTAVPTNNLSIGGPAPKCTVLMDTGLAGLSGGTQFQSTGLAPNSRTVLDRTPIYKVSAGTSIGVNVLFGAAATSALTCHWLEL